MEWKVGLEKETFDAIAKMNWIAKSAGTTLTLASLTWLMEQDGVSSILMGARSPKQLTDNLACLETQLEPVVMRLLCDAGYSILMSLGPNLDPYEGEPTSRIC